MVGRETCPRCGSPRIYFDNDPSPYFMCGENDVTALEPAARFACSIIAELRAEVEALREGMRSIRFKMDMAMVPGNDKRREIEGVRAVTALFIERGDYEGSSSEGQ